MKIDDDVFVNVFALIPSLQAIAGTNDSSTSLSSSSRMLLLCLICPHSLVVRYGKWALTLTDYPLKTFPKYCAGAAYIMTMNFVRAARHLVTVVPLIPIEDVS